MCDYPHRPADYRDTDKHRRLEITLIAPYCTLQCRAPYINRCTLEVWPWPLTLSLTLSLSRSIFWYAVVDIRDLALPSAVKSNNDHYQSSVFACVSVISGHKRIIARIRSIGFQFNEDFGRKPFGLWFVSLLLFRHVQIGRILSNQLVYMSVCLF